MLEVKLTLYDGCEWTHKDLTLRFKNKKELKEYEKRAAAAMDWVKIHEIKIIKWKEVKTNEKKYNF